MFKVAKKKEIVTKDLDRISGREIPEENPDRLLTDLGKDLELYDKIFEDDRVNFSINLKKRLILSIPHRIVPASEEEKDLEIAQEIRDQLGMNGSLKYEHEVGFSFINFLDNALDAMGYGYKVVEKVFRPQEGKIVLYNLKHRHSQYFDFDYDVYGNLEKLLIGRDYGKDLTIEPAEKIKQNFMLFIYPYPKDGNFYGDSDFKEIYEQYRAKKQIFRFRNIHLQNYGSPIPIVTYDKKTTATSEINEMQDFLDNLQDQYYMMIPGNWSEGANDIIGKFKVDFRELNNGSATDQYEKAIDQIDKQITRSLLIPDKLGFSESAGGSYNLAEIQDNILASIVKYMHSWLEKPVNGLIKQMVDFNFTPTEGYPRFEFDEVNDDIKENILQILFNNGVIDKREKWIRAKYGIPELTEKEEEEIEEAKKKEAPEIDPFDKQDKPNNGSPKDKNNKDVDDAMEDKEKEDKKKGLKHSLAKSKNPFNASSVEKALDMKEAEFVAEYNALHKANSDSLIKQIEKKQIIEKKDLKLVDSLRIKKTELKRFLSQRFAESYFFGKIDVITEVQDRLKKATLLKIKQTREEGAELQEGFLLATTQQEAHWHNAMIDENGEGETTATVSLAGDETPHVHKISDYNVLPIKPGGHEHDISGMASLKKYSLQTEVDWLDKEYINRILEKHGDLGTLSAEDIEELKQIRDRGFSIAGVEETRMLKEVRNAIDQGISSGMPANALITQITTLLAEDRKKHAATIARTNISNHYNAGRMNMLTSSPLNRVVEAFQYTAIIDSVTTMFCRSHDNQIIKAGDPQLAFLTPPNHFNCRSTLIPILVGEKEEDGGFFSGYDTRFKPWGADVPKDAVSPAKGFGGR